MGEPVTVNIPHKLGLEQAKIRMASGIHKISESVPGAMMKDHHWDDNTLHCTLEAMGQSIIGEMEVRDTEVYAVFDLPPLLALFANKIKEKLQKDAPKMLE